MTIPCKFLKKYQKYVKEFRYKTDVNKLTGELLVALHRGSLTHSHCD